jgi:CheY-like chemotaxis protein
MSTVARPSTIHSNTRVLLAEDLDVVRDLYAELLTRAGYSVDVARDGLEAWTLLKSRTYDILVTDHMMPYVSGLQLLRLLRKENPDLPTLLVSGDLPVHEPDLATLVVPGGLLLKPFSRTQLLNAVEAAIAASRAGHLCPN